MKKIISFSLYGSDRKYTHGMIDNVALAKMFYPDWEVFVYHDKSVPEYVIDKLNESPKVTLVDVTGCGILAAMWRFLAADEDCERFIVRDSDSRLSAREAAAVKEWEEEDKIVHIMRDHPHHGYRMLGGMWGAKKEMVDLFEGTMKQEIFKYSGYIGDKDLRNCTDRETWWMQDQFFLAEIVYLKLDLDQDATIHAGRDYMHKVTTWNNEPSAKDFPTQRSQNKHFVGEIFLYDDLGETTRDYQWTEL
jgi:hypothetical protein